MRYMGMEACHVPDTQETPVPPDPGVQVGFLGPNLPPAIPSPATTFPSMPREALSYHFGLNVHTLLQPVPPNQDSAGNTWDIAAVPNTS